MLSVEDKVKLLSSDDYRNAILVQDACNLSGVVHSFSAALTKIWKTLEAEGRASTDAVNTHPIAVMYASKVASLTGCESHPNFKNAYEVCRSECNDEIYQG